MAETLVIACLAALAALGWLRAYHERRRAEQNAKHYRIAMDGWRARDRCWSALADLLNKEIRGLTAVVLQQRELMAAPVDPRREVRH